MVGRCDKGDLGRGGGMIDGGGNFHHVCVWGDGFESNEL